MADLERVRIWAQALITLHLPNQGWSFRFDNAKRRAGLCNYTAKEISVSRYLAARYEDDEIHQILLHEVAHALAGSQAAHGPKWRRVAEGLGYEGSRLHHGETADELAPWVGTCPQGHTIFRYRKPVRRSSCAECSASFDPQYELRWIRREITAATRAAAMVSR
ncbi:M48 family peptidase [Mycetocola lacteus]|uniref:M48 family peptidase n=1 Tax=Mycetocola lacteus TaxID=76637 RepID=A0A3L7ATQ4_9MICO|nr:MULTISPECIES: SprT-like domain-containing protein [Mycetocola]MCS4277659.1 putative SprT family Zn-dependent metalloprotease [Mycetocola sp. BIGb0189]RLP83899.1 M48 family peptidase [Mycetocola lacteus]